MNLIIRVVLCGLIWQEDWIKHFGTTDMNGHWKTLMLLDALKFNKKLASAVESES
jgi:hypothetical protein